MKATDALVHSLESTQSILTMYLNDLSDADLLVRPVPEANHLAWQLGHLIVGEVMLGKDVPGAKYAELPPGFAEKYTAETSKQTDTKGYLTKAAYLGLFTPARAATVAGSTAAPAASSSGQLQAPGWLRSLTTTTRLRSGNRSLRARRSGPSPSSTASSRIIPR